MRAIFSNFVSDGFNVNGIRSYLEFKTEQAVVGTGTQQKNGGQHSSC